jgi:hypothetical protein
MFFNNVFCEIETKFNITFEVNKIFIYLIVIYDTCLNSKQFYNIFFVISKTLIYEDFTQLSQTFIYS